jgi:hypothetical protein
MIGGVVWRPDLMTLISSFAKIWISFSIYSCTSSILWLSLHF